MVPAGYEIMGNISGLLDRLMTIPEEWAAWGAYSCYVDVVIISLRRRAGKELSMPNRKDPFVSQLLGKVEGLQCGLISWLHLLASLTPCHDKTNRAAQLLFLLLRSPNIQLGLESHQVRALATSMLGSFRLGDYYLVLLKIFLISKRPSVLR